MLEDCCDPIGWGQEEKQWHGGSKAVEQVCFKVKRERARETGQVLISSHSPAMERSSVCVFVYFNVLLCVCVLGVPRAESQLQGEKPAAVGTSALAPWEPHQWPEDTT